MDGTITITRARLHELLETEAAMNALEAGGVNGGWDWFDASLEDHLQDVGEADVDAERATC